MMQLIAGYKSPQPQRPPQHLIGYAKTEVHWVLIANRQSDPAQYPTLRALFVAQWKAARNGSLQPEFFYTTAKSMAETMAHLIAMRRAQRVQQ